MRLRLTVGWVPEQWTQKCCPDPGLQKLSPVHELLSPE